MPTNSPRLNPNLYEAFFESSKKMEREDYRNKRNINAYEKEYEYENDNENNYVETYEDKVSTFSEMNNRNKKNIFQNSNKLNRNNYDNNNNDYGFNPDYKNPHIRQKRNHNEY